jgi:PIN domain nuclease of toxin-antitoxin system
VKCLLDTHVFLWMLSGDEHLSTTASDTILNPSSELFFSMASYWEICIKLSIKKLAMKRNWPDVFEREMSRNGIQWVSLKPEHARGVVKLPWHHRDPFDRLIVSQCKTEKLTCITADEQIHRYDVRCLW